MAIALIFAGGTGKRMNSKTKPKQFLELHGKPILIHTIEHFEKNKEITGIAIVCLESWIDTLKQMLGKFNIKKVKWMVKGGSSGQASIFNGLQAIWETCLNPSETIVLIHDGVRPVVTDTLISKNIACVREHGNAITVAMARETIVQKGMDDTIANITERKNMQIAKAPQAFFLDQIYQQHIKARKEGITNMTDSASLMKYYQKQLYTVHCGTENLKITTPMDFYIFRAIYEAKENAQILGFDID